MSDLSLVFAALRKIMAPYAERLTVERDDDQELYLNTRHIQKNKQPLFFGAVQIKKAYVSFHLMPVYTSPELLGSTTSALRARMQGKSCFNFSVVEPALFQELEKLTQAAFASYKKQGFVQ